MADESNNKKEVASKKPTHKATRHINEDGQHYAPGEELTLTAERAKALGSKVEKLG